MPNCCLAAGVRRASAAELVPNSRRGEIYLDACMWQVEGRVSSESQQGFGGATLEWAVGFSIDPIAADINLYRYCGNDPLTRTDATGLAWIYDPATGKYWFDDGKGWGYVPGEGWYQKNGNGGWTGPFPQYNPPAQPQPTWKQDPATGKWWYDDGTGWGYVPGEGWYHKDGNGGWKGPSNEYPPPAQPQPQPPIHLPGIDDPPVKQPSQQTPPPNQGKQPPETKPPSTTPFPAGKTGPFIDGNCGGWGWKSKGKGKGK